MQDERYLHEMNQTKFVILIYVFFASIVATLIKLLTTPFTLPIYALELFVFLLSFILLMIRFALYQGGRDERKEQQFERIANIFFLLLFFGGLTIHFIGVATLINESLLPTFFTSTYLIIGEILLIIQLVKRKIYFHQPFLDLPKRNYLKRIFKRLVFLLGFFLIQLLPFILMEKDLFLGTLIVGISYFSLSILYLVFAIFEKNHYEEQELLAGGQARIVTKNAAFLYILVIVYSFGSMIFSVLYNITVIFNRSVQELEQISIIRYLYQLFSFDFALIFVLIIILLHHNIKRFRISKPLEGRLVIYFVSLLVIGFINYLLLLFQPLILRLLTIETIGIFSTITQAFAILTTLYYLVVLILIALELYRLKVKGFGLFLYYAISPSILFIPMYLAMRLQSAFLAILFALAQFAGHLALFLFFKQNESLTKTIPLQEERLPSMP